ncbi:MAG: hypothetical protein QM777_21250 [Pseudorhodoferax sp.]
MASMAPYLAEDGIVVDRWQDGRWLAHGAPFAGLATASPERVLGEENLNAWLPASPLLRRLQNEMQMLLYTHPVNDAREARRQVTVNALWISGCGSWPATPPQAAGRAGRGRRCAQAPARATGPAGPPPGSRSTRRTARRCCSACAPASPWR